MKLTMDGQLLLRSFWWKFKYSCLILICFIFFYFIIWVKGIQIVDYLWIICYHCVSKLTIEGVFDCQAVERKNTDHKYCVKADVCISVH